MDNYQLKVLIYLKSNIYLKEFYKYYMDHCTSQCLPYHNMKHTFLMMYHIIEMFENQEKYTDITLNNYDLLVLLVSALYHDYNHSGGLYTDKVNVDIALSGYYRATATVFNKVQAELELKKSLDQNVIECIIATQYPYIEELDINNYQQIIRELDIISQISPDLLTHVLCGLKYEKHCLNWKDAISNYVEFIQPHLDNLKIQYCAQYWKQTSESFLATIKELLTTLY